MDLYVSLHLHGIQISTPMTSDRLTVAQNTIERNKHTIVIIRQRISTVIIIESIKIGIYYHSINMARNGNMIPYPVSLLLCIAC